MFGTAASIGVLRCGDDGGFSLLLSCVVIWMVTFCCCSVCLRDCIFFQCSAGDPLLSFGAPTSGDRFGICWRQGVHVIFDV